MASFVWRGQAAMIEKDMMMHPGMSMNMPVAAGHLAVGMILHLAFSMLGLAAFFRTGGQARRGCLMINTIAEDEGRGTLLGPRGQAFRDRLSAAFANAMTGQHEPGLVSERVQFLTAATFGIWLTARIDPASAAQAATATAACICSWQQAPDGPGSLC